MEDLKDGVSLDDRLGAAAISGMTMAVWAELKPDAVFIHDPTGKTTTFSELNAAANRIVRLLRQHGLKAGDAVALVCSNRAEFVEVLAACSRGGWRITPVNWHLTADEIAYIVSDCEAKAVFCEARVTASAAAVAQAPGVVLKVAIGGPIPGTSLQQGGSAGPYRSKSFRLKLGNGNARLRVDGKLRQVPDASPVAFKISKGSFQRVDPKSVPNCA